MRLLARSRMLTSAFAELMEAEEVRRARGGEDYADA